MPVIWKRPDGSQNANPEHFRRIQLSSGDKIWVYKDEIHNEDPNNTHYQWYPFQLGGDWSREEETKRLNRFVNMLDASDDAWKSVLYQTGEDDMDPQGRSNLSAKAKQEYEWIESLEKDLKGDKWEIGIIQITLQDIKARLQKFF